MISPAESDSIAEIHAFYINSADFAQIASIFPDHSPQAIAYFFQISSYDVDKTVNLLLAVDPSYSPPVDQYSKYVEKKTSQRAQRDLQRTPAPTPSAIAPQHAPQAVPATPHPIHLPSHIPNPLPRPFPLEPPQQQQQITTPPSTQADLLLKSGQGGAKDRDRGATHQTHAVTSLDESDELLVFTPAPEHRTNGGGEGEHTTATQLADQIANLSVSPAHVPQHPPQQQHPASTYSSPQADPTKSTLAEVVKQRYPRVDPLLVAAISAECKYNLEKILHVLDICADEHGVIEDHAYAEQITRLVAQTDQIPPSGESNGKPHDINYQRDLPLSSDSASDSGNRDDSDEDDDDDNDDDDGYDGNDHNSDVMGHQSHQIRRKYITQHERRFLKKLHKAEQQQHQHTDTHGITTTTTQSTAPLVVSTDYHTIELTSESAKRRQRRKKIKENQNGGGGMQLSTPYDYHGSSTTTTTTTTTSSTTKYPPTAIDYEEELRQRQLHSYQVSLDPETAKLLEEERMRLEQEQQRQKRLAQRAQAAANGTHNNTSFLRGKIEGNENYLASQSTGLSTRISSVEPGWGGNALIGGTASDTPPLTTSSNLPHGTTGRDANGEWVVLDGQKVYIETTTPSASKNHHGNGGYGGQHVDYQYGHHDYPPSHAAHDHNGSWASLVKTSIDTYKRAETFPALDAAALGSRGTNHSKPSKKHYDPSLRFSKGSVHQLFDDGDGNTTRENDDDGYDEVYTHLESALRLGQSSQGRETKAIYREILAFIPEPKYMSIDTIRRAFSFKGQGQEASVLVEAIIWPTIFGFTVHRTVRNHDYDLSVCWAIDPRMLSYKVEHLRDCLQSLSTTLAQYNDQMQSIAAQHDYAKVGIRDKIRNLSRHMEFLRAWIAIHEFYSHNKLVLPSGNIDLHGQSAESATMFVHFFINFYVQRSRFFRHYLRRKEMLIRTGQSVTTADILKGLRYEKIYDGFADLLPDVKLPKLLTFIVGLGNHSPELQGILQKIVLKAAKSRKKRIMPLKTARSPVIQIIIDERDSETGMSVADCYGGD